jgi:myosin heavy subunit
MVIWNKQDGKTKIYVITSVVMLWLVATFLFFVLYGLYKDLEQESALGLLKLKDIKEQAKQINSRLHKIQSLTGFYEKGSEDLEDTTQVKLSVRDVVENLNKMNNREAKDRGTRLYYGLTQLEYAAEIEEDKLPYHPYPINIEKVITAFAGRISQMQQELVLLEGAISSVSEERKAKMNEREQLAQKLNGIITELDKKQSDLDSKFDKQLQEVGKQKQEAEEAKSKAEEETKKLEKELQTQKLDFENEVNKRKSEIRKLQAAKYGRTTYSEIVKQREFNASEEKEDGSVVFADPRARTVYINLGSPQKATRGLKMDVYRPDVKGSRSLKGRIEIVKVMDNVSMATVLEQSAMEPVGSGDLVVNPIFQTEHPVYLVFAGEFAATANTNAKKMVEQIGGKVEDEVTAKTNFVVIGDKKGEEHPNYQTAIRFGIPLMTEKILLRYIGD